MTPHLLSLVLSIFPIPVGQMDAPPLLTFDKRIDYFGWWNDFVSRGKKDNALPFYETLAPDAQGQGGFPAPGQSEAGQMEKVFGKVWTESDYPELAAYLKECRSHLKTLSLAAMKRHFWQPVPENLENIDQITLPYLGPTRKLTKAALAEASRKQDDQSAAILKRCRHVLRLADHLYQGALTISTLTACIERDLVNTFIRAALAEGSLPEGEAGQALLAFSKAEPAPFALDHAFLMEWTVQLDYLQYLCPGGKIRDDRWKWFIRHMKEAQPQKYAAYSPPDKFDPAPAALLIQENFEGLLKIARKPLTFAGLQELDRYQRKQQAKLESHPYCLLTSATLTRAYEICLQTECNRRATLLVLALHTHHHKLGEWPKTLDTLDLPEVTDLRIDPFSGNNFVYELKGGGPRMYSVGSDGKDDGGTHDAKWSRAGRDFVFWPYPSS